jgi:hypothetical protein
LLPVACIRALPKFLSHSFPSIPPGRGTFSNTIFCLMLSKDMLVLTQCLARAGLGYCSDDRWTLFPDLHPSCQGSRKLGAKYFHYLGTVYITFQGDHIAHSRFVHTWPGPKPATRFAATTAALHIESSGRSHSDRDSSPLTGYIETWAGGRRPILLISKQDNCRGIAKWSELRDSHPQTWAMALFTASILHLLCHRVAATTADNRIESSG